MQKTGFWSYTYILVAFPTVIFSKFFVSNHNQLPVFMVTVYGKILLNK